MHPTMPVEAEAAQGAEGRERRHSAWPARSQRPAAEDKTGGKQVTASICNDASMQQQRTELPRGPTCRNRNDTSECPTGWGAPKAMDRPKGTAWTYQARSTYSNQN